MNTILELNNILGCVPDIQSLLRIGDVRVKPRTIKCIFHGQFDCLLCGRSLIQAAPERGNHRVPY